MLEAMQIETTRVDPDDAAQLLAVIADPVRWRLVAELDHRGTLCVCELKPIAGVAANVLSYHLKVLREAGVVTAAKRGRWVDYTLAVDAGDRLAEALPARSGEPLVIDDKRMLSGRVPHTAEVRELSTATQH